LNDFYEQAGRQTQSHGDDDAVALEAAVRSAQDRAKKKAEGDEPQDVDADVEDGTSVELKFRPGEFEYF